MTVTVPTRLFSKSISGFGASKWMLGGSSPERTARTALMNPATPAAVSR